MAVQDYKINYKSDFVLNINGDAGWAIPFCIKFWTGMPSQAYFVGFDGVKYVNCRVGDTPTQLMVMFDDHHLSIGKLMMQIAYHTTIEEFPGSVFDEVTNARDVIVNIDGTDYQVMLDFTGEDAPELEFDLPAYANEAERIQNELQRQQNEADRIAAELQREQASAAAIAGAENVNAQLNGTTLTVTNRNGVSTSVNTKGEQGEQGPVGPEGPQGQKGVSVTGLVKTGETDTDTLYNVTFSDGTTQAVAIPKGAKGDTGATGPTGPQGPQGQTGVSITGLVKTGETETDTLYNVTFSDGTTQAVAIPKGERGERGPAGPTGPQGPMGDAAVITPEQQAAFTMYSVPGQNTNGPMTQKAVTDALGNIAASGVSYDNSQSGLAATDVQGAVDEIEEKAVVYTPVGFYIPSNSSVSAWFDDAWLTTYSRNSFVIPRKLSWQRMKVTANANYFCKIAFLDNTYTEPIDGHSSEFISTHIITAGTSEELNIPTNCSYIAVAASPNSTTNTEYLPVGIEMYETNTSHHEVGENISDTTYTYISRSYQTILSAPIESYERVRVRVIITNSTTPKVNTTLLEVYATYNGVSTNVFRNYGKSIHDADITLSGDKLSSIFVGGGMAKGSVARVIIDGYGAVGKIEKLAEEVAISIPNSPSAFVAGNGKWVTRNDNNKGVFVPILPNTSYRIVGDSDTSTQYAILTSNAFVENEYISTYAQGEFLRTISAGGEDVIVTPEDARFINVGYLKDGVIAPPTIYKNGMAVINKTISNANNISGVNQDAVIVAAFNAPASIKEVADFVCDGINDEVELQRAINRCQSLARGCKVILSSGVFYIDDFPYTEGGNNEGNKLALKINNNNPPISIEGDSLPFSITESNRYVKGSVIMVSNNCYENLDDSTTYKIIGSDFISKIASSSTIDFRIYNVDIKIPWNQKKIIGIDCRSFNRVYIEMVTVSCILNGYNGWKYSYGGSTHYPDIPVEGSIGIRMMGGSNADHVNTYKNIMVQGFYEGFAVGGEDVLMEHCTSYWCVYPYTFGNYQWEGGFCQPIVMISCSQYKCTNLPLFVDNGFYSNGTHYTGNQEVVMIAYHGEHILDGSSAPGGVIGVAAKETTNKMFKGYIEYGLRTNSTREYRMQSDPLFLFWQPGYGEGFITRNNAHNPACTSSERTTKMKGNYLEKVFDTTLGKEVMCIDTENQTWIDANGNVV